MTLPLAVAIKSFLGLYVLTPLEQHLLNELHAALNASDREVLEYQLAHFTTIRRMIRHLDEPKAHGFTNFYTLRFGKNVSDERQPMRFACDKPQALLASARITFDDGEIEAQFWVVRGLLFRIEYRSRQKVYYPPGDYRIESLTLWPKA